MTSHRALIVKVSLLLLAVLKCTAFAADEASIRVATYNVSLFRDQAGQLIQDLSTGANDQARRVAEVIQRIRPDILLVNEFDYDAAGRAAELFRTKYLAVAQNGCEPIEFPHQFTAPVNTGRPTDRDLDKDGQVGGPADAVGYGRHEGQYGMLVLSRFPIERGHARTFQKFLWRDMPEALLPKEPNTGAPFYNSEDLASLPPLVEKFLGCPGRNSRAPGRRSGRWKPAAHPASALLPPHAARLRRTRRSQRPAQPRRNSPRGRLHRRCVRQLSNRRFRPTRRAARQRTLCSCRRPELRSNGRAGHRRRDEPVAQTSAHQRFVRPKSIGGLLIVKQHADQHVGHRGNPAEVTSNFTAESHGCLRIDYALPSRGLKLTDGGVFWPAPGEPGSEAVTASDHRLVWIDISL